MYKNCGSLFLKIIVNFSDYIYSYTQVLYPFKGHILPAVLQGEEIYGRQFCIANISQIHGAKWLSFTLKYGSDNVLDLIDKMI